MNEPTRPIRENKPPATPAEEALAEIIEAIKTGEFDNFFPVTKQEEVITNAKAFEEWEKETAPEALAIEEAKKIRVEITYIISAINFLEESLKTRKIPERASFASVYSHVTSLAQKLAMEKLVTPNPENYGVLGTLKALIDLEKEGFSKDSTVKEIIKELDDKQKILTEAVRQYPNAKK